MTVYLRAPRGYARAAEQLAAERGGAARVTPGRWGLFNQYGQRIAVAQVRRAPGVDGAAGWIESWSVLRRAAVRYPLGPRTLRFLGTRPEDLGPVEASAWASAVVARPPSAEAVAALPARPDGAEGQLWQLRQQRGGQRGAPCGWLLREILPSADGSERWMDHWILFARHQHPSASISWEMTPVGRCDLPTFFGRMAGGAPGRTYVQSSYTMSAPARPARALAFEPA